MELRPVRTPSLILALLLTCASGRADEVEVERFFENQVRPLLVSRCITCHGDEKQQAGLRLDSRQAMLDGVDGSPVIAPGSPDESRLVQVLHYAEDDTQMPPAGKLPDNEIAVLTRWIAGGAIWPDSPTPPDPTTSANGGIDFAAAAAAHWAYRPVVKPPLPAVAADEETSPVDRFLRARLESAGLTYSPRADPRTLLRRAAFDLTGLPPTYEQVQGFESNPSAEAYAAEIERLLALPQYGERWGRHWLDVARYADTKGYVFTQNPKYPFAYTYRDYVVRALNEDKPFNRFVVEQLAADLLGLPEGDPALAALGFLTVGPRLRGNPHDIIDDRIDVVTRGLMGMTVACARCHDHKYDPIPTADYYSLYGIFNSSFEPDALPTIGQTQDAAAYQAYLEERSKREQAVADYIAASHADLLKQAREHAADYLLAVVQKTQQVPPGVELTFKYGRPRENLTNLWSRTIDERIQRNDPVFAAWGALAALPQEAFGERAQAVITQLASPSSAETASANPHVVAALESAPPQSMVDVARIYGRLLTQADAAVQQVSTEEGSGAAQAIDEATAQLQQVLSGPGSLTAIPVNESLFERDHRDHLTNLRRKVDEWDSESPGAPPRAMLLLDKPQSVEPVVFLRGTPGRNGDQVPRRFPQVLSAADSSGFTNGSGRLELAEAIVSRDNPLTARVIVNRVWMHHFGTPLVATTSDFGARSDPPTHPELLDWLAASLIESGWSLKWLHREIMNSAAYQQASIDRLEARKIDPENRLLWRMNRLRLEFEPMRDAMLAVAGRLDPTVGGRPVDIEANPETGRRSIYAYIDRNNFSPLLRTFDYPSPDVHSPGRPLTSVPQQTLYALNAPFPQQMGAAIADRPEVQSAQSPEDRVRVLYRTILSREPLPAELELAAAYLQNPENLPRFAQALLVSNEFLFVD